MIIFRGEPVEIQKIEGGNYENAYIGSAYWTKTGVNLTEEELIALGDERPDVIDEKWMGMMSDSAEIWADYWAGR